MRIHPRNNFQLNNKVRDEHISTHRLKLEFGVRAELKLKIDLEINMKRKIMSKRAFRFGAPLHIDFRFAPNRIKSKSKFLVGRVVVKCLAQI